MKEELTWSTGTVNYFILLISIEIQVKETRPVTLSHTKILLRITHNFQHFCKSTESLLGGGGKSSCMLSIMLVLTIVLVHETSLTNQHFYSMLLGEGGVCKKSTL